MARAWSLAAVLGAAAGATGQVTFTPLPALPVAGGGFGSPRGVSGDGTTATGYANYLSSALPAPMLSGGAGRSESAAGVEAFRWEAGVMTGLGDLPGGGFASEALGVSADGSVIVGWGTGLAGPSAVVWRGSGAEDLKSLLISLGTTGLEGWTLTGASDVSLDGMTIVGYGTNAAGLAQGFIVTIPVPASIVVLALGVAIRRRLAC